MTCTGVYPVGDGELLWYLLEERDHVSSEDVFRHAATQPLFDIAQDLVNGVGHKFILFERYARWVAHIKEYLYWVEIPELLELIRLMESGDSYYAFDDLESGETEWFLAGDDAYAAYDALDGIGGAMDRLDVTARDIVDVLQRSDEIDDLILIDVRGAVLYVVKSKSVRMCSPAAPMPGYSYVFPEPTLANGLCAGSRSAYVLPDDYLEGADEWRARWDSPWNGGSR